MYDREGRWPQLDDAEGAAVPDGIPLVDSHVHLFPPRLFEAIWRWFDKHAWPVRYRLHAEEVVAFLTARGVKRFCGLAYSHTPELARLLNRTMYELGRVHPEVIPLGTVLPGEPDARAILHEALSTYELRGLKIHCHVQKMAADDPRLDDVYWMAGEAGVPVIIHAGTQPNSAAYGFDTRELCQASRIERVLERHPKTTLVVPHLGMDELPEYEALLRKHEHLWLDTTMAIGAYFPVTVPATLFPSLASRMLYGTDFPNIPYAWDRELQTALAAVPEGPARAALLHQNATRLFLGSRST